MIPLWLQASPTSTSSSSDPFQSIADFFNSGLWTAMQLLFQVFVVLFWLALIYWTYQDARRRIESPQIVAGCTALSALLPFLGAIVYLIIRPPEYLDEARERELELVALERRLGELGDHEGQQILGRLMAREGIAGEGPNGAALRQAGAAAVEDVQDLERRMTELEFRMRIFDRANLPRDAGDRPSEPRTQRTQRIERSGGDRSGGEPAGDTGRVRRWLGPRREQDDDV